MAFSSGARQLTSTSPFLYLHFFLLHTVYLFVVNNLLSNFNSCPISLFFIAYCPTSTSSSLYPIPFNVPMFSLFSFLPPTDWNLIPLNSLYSLLLFSVSPLTPRFPLLSSLFPCHRSFSPSLFCSLTPCTLFLFHHTHSQPSSSFNTASFLSLPCDLLVSCLFGICTHT